MGIHPRSRLMACLRDGLPASMTRAEDFEGMPDDAPVQVCGLVVRQPASRRQRHLPDARRRDRTLAGRIMARRVREVSLRDTSGHPDGLGQSVPPPRRHELRRRNRVRCIKQPHVAAAIEELEVGAWRELPSKTLDALQTAAEPRSSRNPASLSFPTPTDWGSIRLRWRTSSNPPDCG